MEKKMKVNKNAKMTIEELVVQKKPLGFNLVGQIINRLVLIWLAK